METQSLQSLPQIWVKGEMHVGGGKKWVGTAVSMVWPFLQSGNYLCKLLSVIFIFLNVNCSLSIYNVQYLHIHINFLLYVFCKYLHTYPKVIYCHVRFVLSKYKIYIIFSSSLTFWWKCITRTIVLKLEK